MNKNKISTLIMSQYLSYDDLCSVADYWADSYPDFVRLSSIGLTPQGRKILLLEIGRDPDRRRPAICVDGNIHSPELLSCNAALVVADAVIRLHTDNPPGTDVAGQARETLYYVIPRISPDGAEDVLTTGRVSRSAPSKLLPERKESYWVRSDLTGDKQIRQLRMRHPAGEMVRDTKFPRLMKPRTIFDKGPFFKVFPEGFIQNFDGNSVPFPHTLSDNGIDFNRNFPAGWSSECDGAGPSPVSEPETVAIKRFAEDFTNIFAWLNLHTFGGIFIRPPFHSYIDELYSEDMAIYQYIASVAEDITKMPTFGALEDCTPIQRKPMTGTLAAWLYSQRGCISWAVELWDIFSAAAIQKRTPFFLNYATQDSDCLESLYNWDLAHNQQRLFSEWKPLSHPQLGDVEVGGINSISGIFNPPEKDIPAICGPLAEFAILLASLAPRLITSVHLTRLDERRCRVELVIANVGYLPSYVTAVSQNFGWNTPIHAAIRTSGCSIETGASDCEVGHIEGWGQGSGAEGNGPFFQKSRGVFDRRLYWIIQDAGEIEIIIESPRIGSIRHTVTIT